MSLSSSDIDAIKQTYGQMIQSVVASDWAGYAAAYTDDAVFLSPEGDMFQAQGQKSIADWTAELVNGSGVEQIEIAEGVEKIEGDGVFAYLYTPETKEKITFSGDENALEFKGNSVSIFAKQPDNSWKIKLQIWNKQLIETEGQ
jgi:uncharacterized protein (TIGR02246 family)